jgi:pentose-5-phosphate-3-epimerase
MTQPVQIAPSILSADFLNLEKDVALLACASPAPEWLHVDVMDGHFVPNLTVGPPFVRALRRVFTLPLDVHLMIDNPHEQLDWYLEAGAHLLTVHVECARGAGKGGTLGEGARDADKGASTRNASEGGAGGGGREGALDKNARSAGESKEDTPGQPVKCEQGAGGKPTTGACLQKRCPAKRSASIPLIAEEGVAYIRELLARIRAAGALAGISLNPGTPTDVLRPLLGCFDVVLVMSVHPGFGGQSFIDGALEKIRALATWRAKSPSTKDYLIEVDGGINAQTAPLVAKAGADILVAGNALFGTDDPVAALSYLREAAARSKTLKQKTALP